MASVSDPSSQKCLNKSNIKKIGGEKKILRSNGNNPKNYTKDMINNTIRFYQCMKRNCTAGCKRANIRKKKCIGTVSYTHLTLPTKA